ncbi:hypothetical protein BS17DRAFT_767137 [Gyrodon lividus]|nr:hypothetical protein BS17DRAFT_767137 [Gyrodon lividus]
MDAATINDLPNELLLDIVIGVPPRTQINLCRVSHRFNIIATSFVYESMELNGDACEAVKMCRTLTTNKCAAEAVRVFVIHSNQVRLRGDSGLQAINTTPPGNLFLSAFYKLIGRTLRNISNVVELVLLNVTWDEIDLSQCTFPALYTFYSSSKNGPGIAAFLKQHPNLTCVQLRHSLVGTQHTLRDVRLSNLRRLAVPSIYLYLLPKHASVVELAIYWGANDTDFDAKLAGVANSHNTLRELTMYHSGWSLLLIEAVAQHLKDKDIMLLIVIDTSPAVGISMFQAELSRIVFAKPLDASLVDPEVSDMEHYFQAAKVIGEAYRSLFACSFPTDVQWIRFQGSVWLPDLSQDYSIEWLDRTFDEDRFEGTADDLRLRRGGYELEDTLFNDTDGLLISLRSLLRWSPKVPTKSCLFKFGLE